MIQIFKLIMCHLVGDYVLQTDFIAKTKGENMYHLIVHCGLYILPFYFVFGFGWELLALFLSHIEIDALKAKYNKIDYTTDQVFHYVVIALVVIFQRM